MNYIFSSRSVPPTARNGRIYPGGSGAGTSGSGQGSIDTSNFLKLLGETIQEVDGDIVFKKNVYAKGDIVSFAEVAGEPASWWDAMPVASATVLGGIKLGAHLTYNAATGQVDAEAGGVGSWAELDKPAWLAYGTLAEFQAGHGHAALYGNLTEVRADVANPFVDLRLHAPNVSWARIRVNSSAQFQLLGGNDDNLFVPLYAGNIYSNNNRVWDSGNLNVNYLVQGSNNSRTSVVVADANAQTTSGFYYYNTGSVNVPYVGNLLHLGYDNSADWSSQLLIGEDKKFYFRRANGSIWQPWNEVWHTGNLNRSDTDFTAKIISANDTIKAQAIGTTAYYSYLKCNWEQEDAFELGISGHKLITSGNYSLGTELRFWANDTKVAYIQSDGIYLIDGWYRNIKSGQGLYNHSTDTGIYSDAYKQVRIYNSGSFVVDNKITSLGDNAGLFFQNRNGYNQYAWYADSDVVRLYNQNVGDILTVNSGGNLTISGDITAFSDRRLKTNLLPLTDVLSKIEQIQGYYFNRIDSKDNKLHLGFIAQGVEPYFPELVTVSGDGIRSFNYQNYTVVLNEGVKEVYANQKKMNITMNDIMIRLEKLERRVYA